jgi:uncharacterized Zn-binding protein involved in type VI secretion
MDTSPIQWEDLYFANISAITLLSDLNVTLLTSLNGGAINGAYNVNVSSLVRAGNAHLSGTSTLVFNGTGSWTQSSGNGSLKMNTIINTAGIFTVSGIVAYFEGTLTYTSGTVVTTGSQLTITSATTLNTAGMAWENVVVWGASNVVVTLSDNLYVTNLSLGGNIGNWYGTINGFKTYISGTLSMLGGVGGGDSELVMSGTGEIKGWPTGYGYYNNAITIDTAGTITISGSSFQFNGTAFTYVTGTVIVTASTVAFGSNCTINSGPIIWNTVYIYGSNRILTLTSDLYCNLLYTDYNNPRINGYSIYTNSLQYTGTNSSSSTTNIILSGTGTWSGSGTILNNLTINTAGTVTISGTVAYRAGTLTYTAGTVVTTSSTLNIVGTCTLDTNGINWNNVIITTGTITNNSLLTCSALTLAASGIVTFAGTAGFTTKILRCTTAGRTLTWQAAVTYLITHSLTLIGTAGSKIQMTSASTGAIFTLQAGAFQNVQNTNATWMDSSGGRTIYSYGATLSNTTNWNNSQSATDAGNFLTMF